MRVISGTAKRLQLKTVKGMNTRPTTDRIKETLFNMISHGMADCTFLDLFAGSGAIGIEALSRGARKAVFIEKDREAVTCIKENLLYTKLNDKAVVLPNDVITGLSQLKDSSFDYIFMDPPYNRLLEKEVLDFISQNPMLSEDGIVIIEASLETDFSYVEEMGFTLIKEKNYKTNKHVFLERKAVTND